jgi:hypothetical protein
LKISRRDVIDIIPQQFAELERDSCSTYTVYCTHTLNKIRDGIKFEKRGIETAENLKVEIKKGKESCRKNEEEEKKVRKNIRYKVVMELRKRLNARAGSLFYFITSDQA